MLQTSKLPLSWKTSFARFWWDKFTCHLHTSWPLASSLHATKSLWPVLTPLQSPMVSPVKNTDPAFPINMPLMLSSPAVPLYRTNQARHVLARTFASWQDSAWTDREVNYIHEWLGLLCFDLSCTFRRQYWDDCGCWSIFTAECSG